MRAAPAPFARMKNGLNTCRGGTALGIIPSLATNLENGAVAADLNIRGVVQFPIHRVSGVLRISTRP